MMSNETGTEQDQCILEEIEALEAIMSSELEISYAPNGRPLELQTTLYPSTADETGQQFVCLQLHMKFPPKYPDQAPAVQLRNPRGLGDDFVANALKQCQEKCSCFVGSPVIYELIELLRDCLTNSNRPTGHCTICLFDFHPDDVFTYTQCYHHFHSHCLSRFCENLQEQWKEEEKQEASNNAANWRERKSKLFTCPVCREVINVELDALKQAPPPHQVEQFNDKFQIDAKYLAWKKDMEKRYLKQKTNGGIIDREEEDNRFLVVTNIGSSSSEMAPSQEDDNQPPPPPPQSVDVASATKSSKAGRGKWIHRPESTTKEHNHHPRNTYRPPVSNATHRPKKHDPPSHSKERVNETATCRPPPGFKPR